MKQLEIKFPLLQTKDSKMSSNITIPKLEKISVRLFEGDWHRLQRKYPIAGAGAALRVLLRNHLNKVDETPQLEISLENLQGEVTDLK